MTDQPIQRKDVDYTFNILVLDTTKEMRNAHANKDIDKAFTYCEWLFWLLKNHIPEEEGMIIETDWQNTNLKIKEIESNTSINEATRIEAIKKLKELFIVFHMNFLMLAYPKAGITRVIEEGVMDFNKETDYNLVKKIIRGSESAYQVGKEDKDGTKSK